ncbi:hypothetical protein HKX48_006112 [Thoreauomyces humboldtii]|nr:hypothetical protein HKX48_006112 [Thoreauomyces humboldtii]
MSDTHRRINHSSSPWDVIGLGLFGEQRRNMLGEQASTELPVGDRDAGISHDMQELPVPPLVDKDQAQHRARLSILLKKALCYCSFIGDNLERRQLELSAGKNVADPLGGQSVALPSSTAVELAKPIAYSEDIPEPPVKTTLRKRARTLSEEEQSERAQRKVQKKQAALKSSTSRKQKAILKVPGPPASDIAPPRSTRQPTLLTGGVMREYQLVGMEWLISLYENGLNGILADEMGLGKTIQVIAFLSHLWEVGTRGPWLVVVPLSTLVNWVTEFQRFAPTLPVLMYWGAKDEREYMRRHKMNPTQPRFPIIVTTYEISMRDSSFLQMWEWGYIIVDEGHRLKNLDCKLIRELKSYRTANRLLLTGTPIQNNLNELWSLLNFVQPEMFSDRAAFEKCFSFGEDITSLNTASAQREILDRQLETEFVTQLHDILKPFLLRRLKTEVELGLPRKREYVVYAPLTSIQKKLYHATVTGCLRETIREMLMGEDVTVPLEQAIKKTRNRGPRKGYAELEDYADLEDGGLEEGEEEEEETEAGLNETAATDKAPDVAAQPSINVVQIRSEKEKVVALSLKSQSLQSPVVQLRKVCNHPFLFNLYGEDTNALSESPSIVSFSGKMQILDRLLPELFARGHRVLVFSQMTKVLDILGEWAETVKGWDYCRLDGSVGMHERRDEIAKFEKTPSIPLFLLTTRAGGLGINLVSADTVILFDQDWNPQADMQAQDRVHRIGQQRPVVIYRLVTKGTIEERVMDMAEGKKRLGEVVVHKGLFKGRHADYKTSRKILDEELAAILSAECATVGGKDRAEEDGAEVLNDEELERLLQRDGAVDPAGMEGEVFKVVEI